VKKNHALVLLRSEHYLYVIKLTEKLIEIKCCFLCVNNFIHFSIKEKYLHHIIPKKKKPIESIKSRVESLSDG